MSIKIILLVALQLAAYKTVSSQCLNRVLPGCGQNMLPMAETLLPNPLLLNSLSNQVLVNQPYLQGLSGCGQNLLPVAETILPNPVLANQMLVNQPYLPTETIIPNAVMPTTTIIQDSTVANNLANALQLLVVSNLLANTLPCAGADVVVPNYSPYDMMSVAMAPGLGYNYIY